MGEKAFKKVQYGKETTHGTAVAATARWRGTIEVPPDRKPQFPEETLGIRARSQRSVVNQIHAGGITLKTDDAVFQQLPFLFSMGLKGGVTAAEVHTGAGDYLWTFTPLLTGANNPDSFTLEYGDDTQAYEIEYVLCERIRISGKMGADEAVKVEAECFGKQITPTTFTGSLNLLAADAEAMIANMTKFYVDTAWAGIGGTQVTNVLREFSIEILTGVHPKFWANGTKMMASDAEGYVECMITLTFEGNSTADAYFDLFQAGTTRAIRIANVGSAIGAGEHSLVVDAFGTFEEVVPMGAEQDGNNLHTAVFHVHSNGLSTPAMLAVAVTTNKNSV